jgi:hypothetical protein
MQFWKGSLWNKRRRVLVLSRARTHQGVAAPHQPRLAFSARGARPSMSALVPRLEHASSTRGRQVPAVTTCQTAHAPPAQAACMSCPCRSGAPLPHSWAHLCLPATPLHLPRPPDQLRRRSSRRNRGRGGHGCRAPPSTAAGTSSDPSNHLNGRITPHPFPAKNSLPLARFQRSP